MASSSDAKWDGLVAAIASADSDAKVATALQALAFQHPDAKEGKSLRYLEAARNDFHRRWNEPTSPWISKTSGLAAFGIWVDVYLMNRDGKRPPNYDALHKEFTALRKKASSLKRAGLTTFAPRYNAWLDAQFARRIEEVGGPAAAAAAAAGAPSPDSAASSPVMVPETIAADSDSESGSASGSVSGSVSGSNSEEEEEGGEDEEEEEEVQPVAGSVAGASSVGSAAPDAALVADLARLQLELAASQQAVHERDAKIRDANAARDKAVSALANVGRLNSNYTTMQTDLQTAKATNTDLQAQIDRLEGEVQAAASEKADLRARLDALVKSTDKERAAMLAQINAFAAGNPGDNSALVQTLMQQNADLTAQHEADQAQVQLATNKLTSMQTADKESIRRLQAELARMQIAPDDLDVSPAPTESHSRVPSPVNVPKQQQQRLEPYALYVLLAGLVSA